jgi:hypothetical protein
MFRMTDEEGGDNTLLCVPAHDPRLEDLRAIHHLPQLHRRGIQHFFEIYKIWSRARPSGLRLGRPLRGRDRRLPAAARGGGEQVNICWWGRPDPASRPDEWEGFANVRAEWS